MGSRLTWGAALIVALVPVAAAAQSVTVTPAAPDLAAGAQLRFTASVKSISSHTVDWLVDGLRYGAPKLGQVSSQGLYTAPVDPGAAIAVPVEAASVASPTISGSAKATIAPAKVSGAIYYVATTGHDTNAGTKSAPFRTIQHAVDAVPGGATIEVEAGIYNELITVTRKGAASTGFLWIDGQAGAVVDGTGLSVPNGEAGLFTVQNASWIRISGFEIRNYKSASADDVPIGIYVLGSGADIEILDNHVHNITTTVTTSSGDALGIAIYGSATSPITDLTIDGNELDDLVTGYSESLAISGNVTDWQVTDNLIHDNDNIGIDIAGFEQVAPTSALDQARQGLVEGNTVYNITSAKNPAYDGSLGADGIYVDGGTEVTIQRNLVHDTDIGIELASEHPGHYTTAVIARDNLVYASLLEGMSIGGYRAAAGGTQDCIIANNTLFKNDSTQSGSGEFQIQLHASGNVFKNNIAYANAQGLLVNAFVASETAAAAMDYNLYFTDASAPQFIWRNKSYASLAAYRKGSEQESDSLYANPKFVSTSTPNLQLSAGSPALAAGKPLGLLDLGLYDFAEKARVVGGKVDIGAYQN